MEWSLDFCLSCDSQISQSDNGAYCSQSCHLADIERASPGSGSPASYLSSSSSSNTLHRQSAVPQTPPYASSGFYLPPALNFSSVSLPKSQVSTPTSSRSSSTSVPTIQSPISSYPTPSSSKSPDSSIHLYSGRNHRPKLFNLPSRSSLSSLHSYSGSQQEGGTVTALPEKVRNELREYAGSFDHIRDWKRRMTVV